MEKNQSWPTDCIWPKPLSDHEGYHWDIDEAFDLRINEEAQELVEIKDYYDQMIEEGALNSDYSLNDEEWEPDIGEEYWLDNRLAIDLLEDDFSEQMNHLKLSITDIENDPVSIISRIIQYEFINENLLRQAFTRRSFGIEYNVGNNEILELMGDTVLNTAVTKIIAEQLTETVCESTAEPYQTKYDEGELSRIRTQYINKENLASRAKELGLDRFILYGKDEKETDSSLEDIMEALLGAVAADSSWDWEILENVTDQLLCIQLTDPDRFLKETYYDMFNVWHQRHFHCMPKYETEQTHLKNYSCTIRFYAPDENGRTSHRIDVEKETRSAARETAAFRAYAYIRDHGLWINLKDANLIPSLNDSINQLQELKQKGYVEEPVYEFREWDRDQWHCSCICSGINGYGKGTSKTRAKKKAAYMVLVRLLDAAGICREEWKEIMWQTL